MIIYNGHDISIFGKKKKRQQPQIDEPSLYFLCDASVSVDLEDFVSEQMFWDKFYVLIKVSIDWIFQALAVEI